MWHFIYLKRDKVPLYNIILVHHGRKHRSTTGVHNRGFVSLHVIHLKPVHLRVFRVISRNKQMCIFRGISGMHKGLNRRNWSTTLWHNVLGGFSIIYDIFVTITTPLSWMGTRQTRWFWNKPNTISIVGQEWEMVEETYTWVFKDWTGNSAHRLTTRRDRAGLLREEA